MSIGRRLGDIPHCHRRSLSYSRVQAPVPGRNMTFLARILAILLAFAASLAPALAERRVALVIGNSAYKFTAALPNPARDAEAMGGLLRAAGFDHVQVERDLDVAGLRKAVREFAARAAGVDVAVVFYAGHGMEIGGRNYLVPVDARLATDFDLEDETVDLERVMQAIEPAKRLRLVILDACRNNPFAVAMRRSDATRAVGRGLAPPRLARGETMIAYAAQPGAVADDGAGANSPFTTALLKHLTSPGRDIRLALGSVRDEVLATTRDRQEPYITGSMGGGELALAPAAVAPLDPRHQATPQTPAALAAIIPSPAQRPANLRGRGTLAGTNFRDCPECPDMTVLPAGKFWMGSPENEPGRQRNEGPWHETLIPAPFAIGRFSVSFEEWDICVSEGGCDHYTPGDNGWGHGKMPVIFVSWNHAQAYMAWLSKKTGETYRLPTETEWEFAARACLDPACALDPFWFGKVVRPGDANYDWSKSLDGSLTAQPLRRTVAVNEGKPNAIGLVHMAGNVRQWIDDCWRENYSTQTLVASQGACAKRGFRGGSWFDEPRALRSAARNWEAPDFRSRLIGFRVVRELR